MEYSKAELERLEYDFEGWKIVLDQVSKSKPTTKPELEKLRGVFSIFFKFFPTHADYRVQYIRLQENIATIDEIDGLFQDCLESAYSTELWRGWLLFCKHKPLLREQLIIECERALSFVGRDVSAAPIWKFYLEVMKDAPMTYGNRMEEGKNITNLRQLYQRCSVVPMEGLEMIWNEYEKFENDLNPQLAKGILSDVGPKFNATRNVWRERKALYDRVSRKNAAVPFDGAEKSMALLTAWKRVIAFEKDNPQKLDSKEFRNHIAFTYRVAIANSLYRYPGIWVEFASTMAEVGDVSSARGAFENAMEVFCREPAVFLAAASFEEHQRNVDRSVEILELALKFENLTRESQTLISINLLTTLRRCKGKQAGRDFLLRMHKEMELRYEFYLHAAEVECVWNNDLNLAMTVLRSGLKKFLTCVPYILSFVDFLVKRMRSVSAARKLLLVALKSNPRSLDLWNARCRLESLTGNILDEIITSNRRDYVFPRFDFTGLSSLYLSSTVSSWLESSTDTDSDLSSLRSDEIIAFNQGFPNRPREDDESGISATSMGCKYRSFSVLVSHVPNTTTTTKTTTTTTTKTNDDDYDDNGDETKKKKEEGRPWKRYSPNPALSAQWLSSPDLNSSTFRPVLPFTIPDAVNKLIAALPAPEHFESVPAPEVDPIVTEFITLNVPLPVEPEKPQQLQSNGVTTTAAATTTTEPAPLSQEADVVDVEGESESEGITTTTKSVGSIPLKSETGKRTASRDLFAARQKKRTRR